MQVTATSTWYGWWRMRLLQDILQDCLLHGAFFRWKNQNSGLTSICPSFMRSEFKTNLEPKGISGFPLSLSLPINSCPWKSVAVQNRKEWLAIKILKNWRLDSFHVAQKMQEILCRSSVQQHSGQRRLWSVCSWWPITEMWVVAT